MKIGKKIAYFRKKMELTQEELADQLEISSQAVSNWETEQNNPDEDVLIKLADIFNVTLDELFDRKVSVGRPDVKGRREILGVHAKGKPLGDDVDLQQIAQTTAGFTGADLENLLNEAAIQAAKDNRVYIQQQDME